MTTVASKQRWKTIKRMASKRTLLLLVLGVTAMTVLCCDASVFHHYTTFLPEERGVTSAVSLTSSQRLPSPSNKTVAGRDICFLGNAGATVLANQQQMTNPSRFRVVFVLGATLDHGLQHQVDKEVQQHRDILQNAFIDSYRNLTHKTVSLLAWAACHCPHLPFLAKIDDDVLVNPFHLTVFFRDQLAKLQKVYYRWPSTTVEHRKYNATECIFGDLKIRAKPENSGKWSTTREEYTENHYPPFVIGPAYVLGGRTVRQLAQHVPVTPYLVWEDVFVTGLVAYASGTPHVHLQSLYCRSPVAAMFTGAAAFLLQQSEVVQDSAWPLILHYSDFAWDRYTWDGTP